MTLRLVLRYAAFQLPELAIVGCVLLLLRHWDLLSAGTAAVLFSLWVAKDVLMFRVTRSAYLPGNGDSSREILGAVGVAHDGLAEEAYVRIGPELWRARRVSGSPPITPGQSIRVVALDGLTVLVEPHPSEGGR
jgi:membrane protein implicated in regulation of membrane protease activity